MWKSVYTTLRNIKGLSSYKLERDPFVLTRKIGFYQARDCSTAPEEEEQIENNDEDNEESPESVSAETKAEKLRVKRLEVDKLIASNPEWERKLQVIKMEMEVLRQEGKSIPEDDFLRVKDWKQLLLAETSTLRLRYYDFVNRNWFSQEIGREKREKRRQLRALLPKLEKDLPLEEFVLNYNLPNNSIFHRIYDKTIFHHYNGRLITACQFGQKLVMDCGYSSHMTAHELHNTAKQLQMAFGHNRLHKQPFDMYFCNANVNDPMMEFFKVNIPNYDTPSFPLHVHSESYLDVFPKSQLVYLTPHCNDMMIEYDHDAVFIVGALVDKSFRDRLSLAKAKKEGLRMMKFPLDMYCQWQAGGGKTLTINQSVKILLDMKWSNNWATAFQNVPQRKIVSLNEQLAMRRPRDVIKFGLWRPNNQQNEQNGTTQYGEPKNITFPSQRHPLDRSHHISNNSSKRRLNLRSIFVDDDE